MSARLRNLQAQKAAAVAAMRAITDKADAEARDLTEDEIKSFDEHKGKLATLNPSIEREQALALEEAGLSASRQSGRGEGAVDLPAKALLTTAENVEQDPQRGFKSAGDFCRAVVGAATAKRTGVAYDSRLAILDAQRGPSAAAPTTYANEAVGADGGFLVPPEYSRTIFALSLEEQALLPLTDQMPVEGNGMSLPKDETTPWGSNGVRAYWQGEASVAGQSKPVLGRTDLRLKKLMALVPVSDELLADATALGAWFTPNAARSIRWKTDEAILFGTGAGTPLGVFAGGSTGPAVTVPIESGQAAGSFLIQNGAKMISRLMPGSYSRAIWLMNNDVLPSLFTQSLNNYPVYFPIGGGQGAAQGSPYGSYLGRPVIVSQHAKSIGNAGDVSLVDLSYYQSIIKSEGIQTATSMHLYFDADATAFRATFRVDGQPKIGAPVNPANGSNTLSPFVQLAAR